MTSHVRNLLALFIMALAVCACGGDNPADDKTAGGQTGGESRQGGEPCIPRFDTREIGFETEGPEGFSAASALRQFGVEHASLGSITGHADTIFHSALSYRGRTRVVCKQLVLDVNLSLRSEDGSFNETIATELTVFSLEDARLSATLSLQDVHGSYSKARPSNTEQKLSLGVSYTPGLTGWIAIEPRAASEPGSIVAKF